MSDLKQMIVLRTDLKMRRGKEIAQGAHASMAVLLQNPDHPWIKEWLSGSFAKIAVGCSDEHELEEACRQAEDADIPVARIVDAGRTEFGGVPTFTCAAIGPAPAGLINPITGGFKLR